MSNSSNNIGEDYFRHIELTELDHLAGIQLSSLTKKVIQNHISIQAHAIVTLEYDPEHPLQFLKDREFKRGMIQAYLNLIDDSLSAEDISKDPFSNKLPPVA
jgi:hypothetical protein